METATKFRHEKSVEHDSEFPKTFNLPDGRSAETLIVVSAPNHTQLFIDLTPAMRRRIGTNVDYARSLADHFAGMVREAIVQHVRREVQ